MGWCRSGCVSFSNVENRQAFFGSRNCPEIEEAEVPCIEEPVVLNATSRREEVEEIGVTNAESSGNTLHTIPALNISVTPNKIQQFSETTISIIEGHIPPAQPTGSGSTVPSDIPSPFKRALFWPTKRNSSKPGRSCRTKVPSVVTSQNWKEYYIKKERLKQTQQAEKEERKRKREENKRKKESLDVNKNIKRKPNRKPQVSDSTSDSSGNDMVLESEGEGDDWNKEEVIFSVDDYVIVIYDNSYFPGKVTNIEGESFEISAMVKSGIYSWKWPSREDKIWYRSDDILLKINTPEKLNERGIYKVPEILRYL